MQLPNSDIDPEILEIFIEEVQEVLEEVITEFNIWKNNEAELNSLNNLVRGFHTLKGSGRLVGATVIGELGWHFENALRHIVDGKFSPTKELFSLLEQVPAILPNILEQFKNDQQPSDDILAYISKVENLLNKKTENELNLDDLEIDDLDFPDDLDLPDDDIEDIAPLIDEIPTVNDDPILFEIFQKETREHLNNLKTLLNNLQENLPEVIREFHTIKGSSRNVDFLTISEIAAPMEEYANDLLTNKVSLSNEVLLLFDQAVTFIEDLFNGKTVDTTEQKVLLDKVRELSEELQNEANKPEDDLPDADDEFITLFLEEADEILENTQSLLERWQDSPDDMQLMKELQRELHTLKGGARMVGIVQMGDLSHHLESVLTRIVEGGGETNSLLQNLIQDSVDALAAMLENLRAHIPLQIPEGLIKQINAAVNGEQIEETVTKTKENKPKKSPETVEQAEENIRVQASLINKLANMAGELSISRAHMEQYQQVVKSNLTEMDQTVIRLRDQLRRLEIETEVQIFSNFADSDEEFDPLELDRFSLMQQLSRSLMESVSDVISIQEILKRETRHSDNLLIQQARLSSDLQEGIMQTRMIPFGKISSRLQRIARVTAGELQKQVNFVIHGETIEFERTILNSLVAPLEHMLRNAIGHGIEDAETRKQAGKSEVANINVYLSREGSELVVKLSDDGAGLNIAAIYEKAQERGLIKPNAVVSKQELINLILQPSFSTAKKVTQVSGRGVGMDVVTAEIKHLGGNLLINSNTGEGTTFEIRVPLSLSVVQTLIVNIGDEAVAIPINYLEALRNIPSSDIFCESDDNYYFNYMNEKYHVFHLGELLGFHKSNRIDRPSIPALLINTSKSRTVLLVDAIEGMQEIINKSVGKQLGTIPWISGASILGDGRVVLIVDVSALNHQDHCLKLEELTNEIETDENLTKIMVVDDSITVRKITARLLERQGMEVLTAKDGFDAIAKLQTYTPDLMLLDVEMPRMDGYELATQIRNNPDLKHLPIIMITSRTGMKHREKAQKLGINRYLGKPFNDTELMENIRDLLS
ncbi:hybrid sensor histidine kinase/response regulator [Candidatus Marithrix sp. Canyon 246]|uniref:hybrid sensor histidine kinase/response regulator n=1 Tax=Candidatus Marithrix sp. Canyon 246 TaxID=1827136 RepID=UPI00084A0867|nr:Hpt domain-containing protein [Candidatus Marithrix sp. Canyon 246]